MDTSNITEELNGENKRTKNILQSYKSGSLLTLNIDQIDFYDKNPRIAKNEKYDEVFVSIQAKGLEGSLSVSQRPDNEDPEKFVLFRGGNTRLAVLKELYETTKDKKYYEINALFHTWVSESDTLIGHLTENDSRGDYIFIDRALGVRDSKLELEKETGDSLSDVGLIKLLAEQGYKLSRPDLARMNFAVDIMYPQCPELLASGIGPRQFDAIKKLSVKASELCLEINTDKKPKFFSQQFASALKQLEDEYVQDKEEHPYNYQRLYDAVLKILSNEERITANRLAFFLDNRINGKADQQQAFDPNWVNGDDEPIVLDSNNNPSVKQTSDTQKDMNTSDIIHIESKDVSPDQSSAVTPSQNESSDNTTHSADEPSVSNEQLAVARSADILPASLDYSISQNTDNHLKEDHWERKADFDPEFSYLTDLPISCGDRKELSPLPNELHLLRQIMFKKAQLFHSYLSVPGGIHQIHDGVGFTLLDVPSLDDFITVDKECDPIDQHPDFGYINKHFHGWWILLGLSNILMLSNKSIDVAKSVIPLGTLHTYLEEFSRLNQHTELISTHKVQFGLAHDVFTHFISHARPKELQLFIELQLIQNKIFTVTEDNIWGFRS